MTRFYKLSFIALLATGLLACSEPEQLKSLVVEFPETDTAQVMIQTDQSELQYLLPTEELTQPELLKQRMTKLPAELHKEVFELLANVEPPVPSPLSKELDETVKVLEGFLGGLSKNMEQLKEDLQQNSQRYQSELEQHMGKLSENAKRLAEQAEQKANGVVSEIKREYVEQMAAMIEQDKLTEEEIDQLEQVLIERHKRQKR